MTLIIALLSILTQFPSASDSCTPSSCVTDTDSRGRMKVMQSWNSNGLCVAEVIFESKPSIHVAVVTARSMRHIGYAQIRDATEEGVSDEVLRRIAKKVISERCLPLIIPGLKKT